MTSEALEGNISGRTGAMHADLLTVFVASFFSISPTLSNFILQGLTI
jgi:hypothetical protein